MTKESSITVYTLQECAEILKCTRQSVYNFIRAGKLPAAKIGNIYRITDDDINAFLDAGRLETIRRNEKRKNGKSK